MNLARRDELAPRVTDCCANPGITDAVVALILPNIKSQATLLADTISAFVLLNCTA
jgi:hypothetical protein